ncbi:MAG: hypothetical protein JST64_00225 [Actinobacteria bacterium]|nr:hypothetical protein [Actinomycetota bacterium]
MRSGASSRFWISAVVAMAAVATAVGCSGSDGSGRAAGRRDTTSTSTSAANADVVLSTTGDHAVATVDDRYQSYNIEMVEVTGGEFWKPYDSGPGKVTRPPIDLHSERLRNLARGLGPAYIRVSGSWANSTYFDATGTSGGAAPAGFGGVLTPAQWKGVGEFARAVDGKVVTSFASSPGVRDATGAWQPDQARALLEFSKANHVPVVAAELFNEPSLPIGFPAGYDAAAFGRDVAAFKKLVGEVMPDLRLVGPGAVEDVTPIIVKEPLISAEDLFTAADGGFGVASYHFYPKVSARCGSTEGPEIALTQEFLSRVEADKKFYEALRDRFAPKAPMWVTETAQAACGGDRWASQFRDVIRYVDNLGRQATGDGDVVFHNTLAASDYGLLDENGFVPRPNYWAAVLWHRLMGATVLAVPQHSPVTDLAVYAHCTPRSAARGVTYAVINSSTTTTRTVATKTGAAAAYVLTSDSLDSGSIALNGSVLTAADDGTLPDIKARMVTGTVDVPPASVAFVVERADNRACR